MLEVLKKINIITGKKKINPKTEKILDKYPSIKKDLYDNTSFMPHNTKTRLRVFCIWKGITTLPVCVVCGKPISFNSAKGRFNEYCPNINGNSCAAKDMVLQEKRKQTMIDRYGVDSPTKSKVIREKVKKTNRERYGGNAPSCSPIIQEKTKATNLERYGAENPQQNSDVKNKTKQTNLKKFGVNAFAEMQVPLKSRSKMKDVVWLTHQHHELKKPIAHIARDLSIAKSTLCRYFHNYNIEVKLHENKHNVSSEELELREYIESIIPSNTPIMVNDRTTISPYELDIYLPSYNLAIEYCGIYWHSELNGGKNKKYHLTKREKCKKKGIHLVQIWGSEWRTKKDIILSRLSSLIHVNERVYGRKCHIKNISSSESRLFFNENHLQGFVGGTHHIGLEYNDTLVAAIIFGKSRFGGGEQWELLRYANKKYTNVIGGSSKLMKHFIREYDPLQIVSYSDNRWNTGKMYENIGFTFSHQSTPNYLYFYPNHDTSVLYSRIKFQKHKLKNLLEEFDSNYTEWENMINAGYDRIWDCGNGVFIWNRN